MPGPFMNFFYIWGRLLEKCLLHFKTLFLSQAVFLFTTEDRRRSEVLENELEKQRDKFQALKFKLLRKEFAENFLFTK